jgi:hypothetical protein
MFTGRVGNKQQELLWPYAAPLFAGIIAYILIYALTGGLFPLFEFGIAIGVAVFTRRLMRR